jgi:hypothetical protein
MSRRRRNKKRNHSLVPRQNVPQFGRKNDRVDFIRNDQISEGRRMMQMEQLELKNKKPLCIDVHTGV